MHRHIAVRSLPAVAALAIGAGIASAQAAQTTRSARFIENCDRNNGDRVQFCETRAVTLAASKALRVDGRSNGGITVHAWDNSQFQIVAMVQAQGETDADARNIARQINVTASNGEIRADGPDHQDHTSWSVSYEVWAPRHTDLSLISTNGGISVDGMDSRMDLETTNGGLSLTDLQGDVHGRTSNGGVTADLTGDSWRGAGLDLRTSNGGVRLIMPTNYSARLETGTVNGRLDVGFPITVSGRLSRNITADLGRGGATIRATTTNGGVSIQRR
jgi:DUF4097 and DUF4098 domain-containing protein YvlB